MASTGGGSFAARPSSSCASSLLLASSSLAACDAVLEVANMFHESPRVMRFLTWQSQIRLTSPCLEAVAM